MAKETRLVMRLDVEQDPALRVIVRLVKAFGAGVQAEETEKAAALAEAVALIENGLKVETGPEVREALPQVTADTVGFFFCEGDPVVVTMKNGVELVGDIYDMGTRLFDLALCGSDKTMVIHNEDVESIRFEQDEPGRVWPSNGQKLFDFMKKVADQWVTIYLNDGHVIRGKLFWNMIMGDDLRNVSFTVIQSGGEHRPFQLDNVHRVTSP